MPVGSSGELDWYDILGVGPSANDAEIGRAFRSLARRFHPDVGPESSDGRFSDAAQAYEVLGHPSRRADYDRTRTKGHRGGVTIPVRRWAAPPEQSPSVDVSEASEAGSLGDVELAVGFSESIRGTVAKVRVPRAVVCSQCSGAGLRSSGRCPDCGGEGRYRREAGQIRVSHVCSGCAGSGARPPMLCDACAGKGWEQLWRELSVRVPAGVADGTRLRLRSPSGGHAVGMARVRICDDPWLSRDGADIVLRLPLSVTEAALGTTIGAWLPDGPVEIAVPAGTGFGARLRVGGRGVAGQRRGDLVAVAQIVLPDGASDEQRSALQALAAVSPDPRQGWPPGDPNLGGSQG